MSETPKAGKRDPRSAAERLKDVAKELFYKQGIRATGVEELCRVAGTTKISLYRAYPSKDELIASVLRDDCSADACWFDKTRDEAIPPRERPRAYLLAAAEAMRVNGYRGCPVGMAIVEFPDPEHPARRVADAYKLKVRQAIHGICAEAGAAEPEVLGDALLMMIEGAYASAPYLGHLTAADSLQRTGLKLLDAALPPE
ncbi:TetR/AcrR family transcriptional regulator [Teichococcus vastitatis]|uniref:TetR/AcrR family transcriptional regulator n=1 Tax=Teichococcus vastitatis TaxID=2307076 RepID=A0ABS9W4A0_9PROT|nr:TetR/AcrR family transcriptional regulator [Pseudoroseomonas vastitatis]MCI0754114.1 TetR/AcrR family transcriptional regulator [Pseudoroseomonas vastitatis]